MPGVVESGWNKRGMRDGGEELAIVAFFKGEAALRGQLGHPGHIEMLDAYATTIVAENHPLQFRVADTAHTEELP